MKIFPSKDRLRTFLVNAGLVAASVAFCIVVLETVFAVRGLGAVPLRYHLYLPENVKVFVQSSKDGVRPVRPIALVGDSYAQGRGDWLHEVSPGSNAPFHSAHVIHDLTHRDVISFGRRGASSFEGLVVYPTEAYELARRSWFFHLESPETIVVYFYEGNDFDDNLSFLRHKAGLEEGGMVDQAAVDRIVRDRIARLRPGEGILDQLVFSRFALNMAADLFRSHERRDAAIRREESDKPRITEHNTNKAMIAGHVVDIPDDLQGPAMELTDSETVEAVELFHSSLRYLMDHFPGTRVLVVYLPSPLASYRLASAEVTVHSYQNRSRIHEASRVEPRSLELCNRIRSEVLNTSAGFIDMHPAVRRLTAEQRIHGPRDWDHFNRIGYTELGRVVASWIDRPRPTDTCATGP